VEQLRVGVVGLGAIARKAYLPVLSSRQDLDIVLATRNLTVLEDLGRQYRIVNRVQTVDELVGAGVTAAFVHAATEAHESIVRKLLTSGIDVYVDKPISYSIDESRDLVRLAGSRGHILMVGFNRRYAPFYRTLSTVSGTSLVLMEKHRAAPPQDVRTFVYDDFIHVVDTLRFLSRTDPVAMHVGGIREGHLLKQLTVEWTTEGGTAVGIMTQGSGRYEERLEVTSHDDSWCVLDLRSCVHWHGGRAEVTRAGDWESPLFSRGFSQVVDAFVRAVKLERPAAPAAGDALLTHELCEQIIEELQ
jgi:virulence factor